ncbi:hypothetical protein ES705_14262 [subsurface metagenome]
MVQNATLPAEKRPSRDIKLRHNCRATLIKKHESKIYDNMNSGFRSIQISSGRSSAARRKTKLQKLTLMERIRPPTTSPDRMRKD